MVIQRTHASQFGDQIQISLKYLLPSYQLIISDSDLVSSFLSERICTDFEHTCRIITTRNAFSQKGEDNPDLKTQANSENADPEIQFQSQYDEVEDDVSGNYHIVFDQSATVVVDRPPPEPLDLYSVAVGEGDLASTVVVTEWRAKHEHQREQRRDPEKSGRGFHRVVPLIGKPPPLLAAVFPWDHGRGRTTGGILHDRPDRGQHYSHFSVRNDTTEKNFSPAAAKYAYPQTSSGQRDHVLAVQ
ncbi:hypothetical protein PIB30_004692 [Stylosanthes scabra]|uniref:Uncharacterized protein n=1 Tax=Stylosanthes scabra TaxID=79078 RepID=A0ABU6R454_9FABA|nr:hypothetical protein [Stylosanthes scabra]